MGDGEFSAYQVSLKHVNCNGSTPLGGSDCSSSEEELDIGPRTVSQGWRDGKPVQVTRSDGLSEAEERLERCVAGLRRLQAKTGARPSFINDELKQELDWTKQEVEVACAHSKSRFAAKYVQSCEEHLRSASNLWRNIKYIQVRMQASLFHTLSRPSVRRATPTSAILFVC